MLSVGVGRSIFLCKEMQPSCPRSTMKITVNRKIIIAEATVSHSHFLRPADSVRRLHTTPWLTIQQHDLFKVVCIILNNTLDYKDDEIQ